MQQINASDHSGAGWHLFKGHMHVGLKKGGAFESLKQSQGTLCTFFLACMLPACLLLEYVRLAQARPTMSCIALCSNNYKFVLLHDYSRTMLICACVVEPGHCISGLQHNYYVVHVEMCYCMRARLNRRAS